jgi:hypothetical protein
VILTPGGLIQSVLPGIGTGAVTLFGPSAFELSGGSITTNASSGHGIRALISDAYVKVTSGTVSVSGENSDGIVLGPGGVEGEVWGGTIDAAGVGLNVSFAANAAIHGGVIRGNEAAIYLGVGSQLRIHGGLLGDMDSATDLRIDCGEAHIYGYGFQLDGVAVGPGLIAGPSVFVGRLTGTLVNGDPLDLGVHIESRTDSEYTSQLFVHIVPEPTLGAMLLSSLACLSVLRLSRLA